MLTRLLLLFMLCGFVVTSAADFQEGGDAYKRGDYETAAKEFLPLAENGDHRAMYALGSMYAEGQGVPQDLAEARRWFSKAALYGRPDAQYKLGLIYALGLGVETDYRRAINWFGKSAKQGYALAQYRVGLMYQAGAGVTASNVKAFAWLQNAASKGVEEAKPVLDTVSSELSPAEKQEAEQMARTFQQQYRSRR